MAKISSNPGFDVMSTHPAAVEARAKGDLTGYLEALGCPTEIAKRAGLREMYKRQFRGNATPDQIERMVTQALEIEKR